MPVSVSAPASPTFRPRPTRPAPAPPRRRRGDGDDAHVWSSVLSSLRAPLATAPYRPGVSPAPVAPVGARSPAAGAGWRETVVDAADASALPLHEALARGHSVLEIDGLASDDESARLRVAASAAAGGATYEAELARGKVRLPVRRLDDRATRDACDALLARGVAATRAAVPALVASLFGDLFAGAIVVDDRLGFTPNEPALNVYRAGGAFPPHEDGQSLTLLVPLSDPTGFDGGGTAFWAQRAAESYFTVGPPPPRVVLTPPAGHAIVFCGGVLHAALPVDAGERVVFVASFSPRSGADGSGRDPLA